MLQGIVLRSLQDSFAAPIRPALQALVIALGLVLLIACSNVANLVLVRALARRREIAVMAALGASRWQIAQRVLTENVLVAVVGGGGGLWLAPLVGPRFEQTSGLANRLAGQANRLAGQKKLLNPFQDGLLPSMLCSSSPVQITFAAVSASQRWTESSLRDH